MLTWEMVQSMPEAYRHTLLRRIQSYSGNDGSCRMWKRGKSSSGYAQMRVRVEGEDDGLVVSVHRLVYMLAGMKPDHQMSHLCHRKLCVRLQHLTDETAIENTRRNECNKVPNKGEEKVCSGHGDRPHCIVIYTCYLFIPCSSCVEVEVLLCSFVEGGMLNMIFILYSYMLFHALFT